jgi:hypothetical protein
MWLEIRTGEIYVNLKGVAIARFSRMGITTFFPYILLR